MLLLSAGTKLLASEANATDRPSADSAGSSLESLPCAPAVETLARELAAHAISVHRASGTPIVLADALVEAAGVQADLGDASAAAGLLAEVLDLTRSGEFRLVAVEAVEGMAWVSAATGDASGAARMLGAAKAMRQETEGGMPPSRRMRLEATEAAVRNALGADPFAAATAAGRALGREAATAEALELARGLAAGAA